MTKTEETALHILRSLPDSTPADFGRAMWPVGGLYNTGRNRKAGVVLRSLVRAGQARRWTDDGRTYLYSAASDPEETLFMPDPHAYVDDGSGGLSCATCGLPERSEAAHPRKPIRAKVVEPDPANRRSFNRRTMEEGMGDAATSVTSEGFRVAYALLMVEVATGQETFSTNDVWDLWEARGHVRSGHAQAAGTVGGSGVALGLWTRTAEKVKNLSGNLHSTDDGVRVYRSRIVGRDPAEFNDVVHEHYGALDTKAAERDAVKRAEAEAPLIEAKADAWDECVEAMTAWFEAQSRPGDNGPPDPPVNPYR